MNKYKNYNGIKVRLIQGKKGEGAKFLPYIKKNFDIHSYRLEIARNRYNEKKFNYYVQNNKIKEAINIRHGFFKNEIINFFVKYNIALKSCPGDNKLESFVEEFLTKADIDVNKHYWHNHINLCVDFSQKLYKFIDTALNNMRLEHCSVQTDDIYKVYIDDKIISNIAIIISKCETPYEFRDVLNSELVKLLDPTLLLIGEDIKNLIETSCKNISIS